MNARFRGAAVLTVVVSLLFAIEIGSSLTSAGLGIGLTRSGPCNYAVGKVGATAAAAGLQAGDTIDLRHMDVPSRAAIALANPTVLVSGTGRIGEVVNAEIHRRGGIRQVRIPLQATPPILIAVYLVFKTFFFFIGLFVLWRGRDLSSLLLGIWCLGISVFFPYEWLGILPTAIRIPLALGLNNWIPIPWPFLLYIFLESLTRGLFSSREVTLWRVAMVLVTGGSSFDSDINAMAQTASGCTLLWLGSRTGLYVTVLSQAMIVAFFILGYVRARGLQRLKLRWVFWSLILSRSAQYILFLSALFPQLATGPVFGWLRDTQAAWLPLILFPIGCSYAILRHRIIDVNFVLNRAVIYTALTTIIIGTFTLLERVFDRVAVNRGLTLTLELSLALGVGLSFHVLHRRVEALIDRTLFRSKYRAAAALRLLADEAAFIENPEKLLERALHEIPLAMQTAGAAIYERSGDCYRLMGASRDTSFPATVDADEPIFVHLRKSGTDIDLGDMPSDLGSAGHAFALSVRGQLFGALVCGRRKDDERYSPDERELMRFVAHEIAAEVQLNRAREQSEFMNALATGNLADLQAIRDRARTLGTTG